MSHTVMVTGADGFIGSHLAEELVKSGEQCSCSCKDWYRWKSSFHCKF